MSRSAPENREVISVSQLNRTARRLLEGEFPTLWVEGEISNFSRPGSGHWYFTLKDEKAQLRCAMFVNRNRLLRFQPENGMNVVVRGRISLYEGRGEFQMVAEFIEESGDGALLRAFEKLKQQLFAEGLFDEECKRPLPQLPRHIGIVTSPRGAAIADVLHVLERRFPALSVTILPVQVQGEMSPQQIVRALELANQYNESPFDLLLLTRGGGSLEDLWAYNTEKVARAIFESKIPVVAAIGHEVDVTIADFVADVRAPTPSAAAEIITPDATRWQTAFSRIERQLAGHLNRNLKRLEERLRHLRSRLQHPGRQVAEHKRLVASLQIRLNATITASLSQTHQRLKLADSRLSTPERKLVDHNQHLIRVQERLQRISESKVAGAHEQLRHLATRLNAVSPLATLERGYAIVTDNNDHVLVDPSRVAAGDTINARLQHGRIVATVDEIHHDNVHLDAKMMAGSGASMEDSS